MKIMAAISGQMSRWFGKSENQASKNERPAETITSPSVFSKLPLQDKILHLGKLIRHSGSDDDSNHSSRERALVILNQKLNRQINKSWSEMYSGKGGF